MKQILERKSIRSFKEQEISDENIKKLIELAVAAPNAGNEQSWFFHVVKDKTIKNKIASASYGQDFVKKASCIIVCCLEDFSASKYSEIAYFYKIQDVACAAQNMLIGCQSMGMGGCYIGTFNRPEIAKILNDKRNPVCYLAIGYPDETNKPKVPRKDLSTTYKIL